MGQGAAKDIEDLFHQHGAMIFRRALRLLGRREDAEEAVQEVFVRIMRSLDEFEQRSAMSTWLYQITTNYCLDLLRQRGRRQQLFAQHIAQDDRPDSPTASDLYFLRQLLSEADEAQARAVIYVYLDGMSYEQAASLLGVSKRTVGNLIDRFLTWAQKRGSIDELKLPGPIPMHVKGS